MSKLQESTSSNCQASFCLVWFCFCFFLFRKCIFNSLDRWRVFTRLPWLTSVTNDESMLNISNYNMITEVFLSEKIAGVDKISLCWWLLVIFISFNFFLCHADDVSHCSADAIFCDIAPVCNLKHLYLQVFQLSVCQHSSRTSTKTSSTRPLILKLFLSSEISYIITPEVLKNYSEDGKKFDWCISPS